MFEDFYYHQTTRKYTILIATLLNDIQIQRGNGDLKKVPLHYHVEDASRIVNKQDADKVRKIQAIYPRMSFRLTDIALAPERKTSKMNKLKECNPSTNSRNWQYNMVPYNFSFDVGIKTKTTDEMLRIVEHILANFDPSVEIKIESNTDLNRNEKVQVKLESLQLPDGINDIEESIEIVSSLSFVIEGHLYKKTNNQGVIKKVIINISDNPEFDPLLDQYIIEAEDG